IIRRTKHYKAHDAENNASLGDIVRIMETRPISKEKRWRIADTLVKGNVAEIAPREIGVPEELLAPMAIEVPEHVEAPEAAELPAAPETMGTVMEEATTKEPTTEAEP